MGLFLAVNWYIIKRSILFGFHKGGKFSEGTIKIDRSLIVKIQICIIFVICFIIFVLRECFDLPLFLLCKFPDTSSGIALEMFNLHLTFSCPHDMLIDMYKRE